MITNRQAHRALWQLGITLCATVALLAAAPAAAGVLDDDPNECGLEGGSGLLQPYGTAPPMTIAPAPNNAPATPDLRGRTAQGFVATEEAEPLPWVDADRESYPDADPEPIRSVAEDPVSTFSADVDTASYAVMRRFLHDGMLPPTDAVRVEELVNYFDYDYPLPANREVPFAASVMVYPAPWNPDTEILQIGIRSFDPYIHKRPAANLVFLVDVSGSMDAPDKLPLVRRALRRLAAELDAHDSVAIVTYAGTAGVHLPPTAGDRGDRIEAAIRTLCPGGSTAGAEGIRTAYELAERNYDDDAVNRVILATDGDFNVGVTDNERLEDYVARQRATGIYLTVLGFGQGNYQDARMQVLAQAGNGVAAYIDGIEEAQKVLVDEMASTLFPVANDVKFQVEFNPAQVAEYRLIGYETRLLRQQDFALDRVDAGDMGAGHAVTALYEIAAPGSPALVLDQRRYAAVQPASGHDGEIASLRIRYKLPGQSESRLMERPITAADRTTLAAAADDARFAAAVAGFAQILRGEPQIGAFSYGDVARLAAGALGPDTRGLRHGFLELVEAAAQASP